MEDGFVFWREPLRVSGQADPASAAASIRSLVTVSGIAMNERLVGALDGDALRVWRNAPFAQAGDVVEFRGVLRGDGHGSVIEGSVGYSLRTRCQFVGFLLLGILLASLGLLQWLREAANGLQLAAIGAAVTLGTLAWIYSSRKLAGKQIAFIEAELTRSLRV